MVDDDQIQAGWGHRWVSPLVFLTKLTVTVCCFVYLHRKFGGLAGIDRDFSDSRELLGFLGWIGLGIFAAGVSVAVGVYRWWLVLRAQGISASINTLTYTSLIGVLIGIVTVGAIGTDAVKILALCRDHPENKWGVIVSIIADHLAGFLALIVLIFVFTVTSFRVLGGLEIETNALLHFVAGLLISFCAFLVGTWWLGTSGVRDRVEKRFPRLMGGPRQKRFLAAYDLILVEWRSFLLAALVSVPFLVLYFFTFYCGLRAVGIVVDLQTVLAVMPVVDFVASLPVSISGFGVREGALGLLLHELSGVGPSLAAVASLAGFGMNAVWGGVGGVWMLLRRDRPLNYSGATGHDG